MTMEETGMILMATNTHSSVISFNVRGMYGHDSGVHEAFRFQSGNLVGFASQKCGSQSRPTVNHLIVIDRVLSPSASHSIGNRHQDIDTVSGIGEGSIVFYLMYASNKGRCNDETEHLAVFNEVVSNFKFAGGSYWPEQSLQYRNPTYSFPKYRLEFATGQGNQDGNIRVRELKFYSKYPSQQILGNTWCANAGDSDSNCFDEAPPSPGHTCECSSGYQDADGVCLRKSPKPLFVSSVWPTCL